MENQQTEQAVQASTVQASTAKGIDIMKMNRKTFDEFVVQGNYGRGWEDTYTGTHGIRTLTQLSSRAWEPRARQGDALARLAEYRENQPEYQFRLIKRRIPVASMEQVQASMSKGENR